MVSICQQNDTCFLSQTGELAGLMADLCICGHRAEHVDGSCDMRSIAEIRFGQHQRLVPSTLKKFSLTRQGLSGAVTRLDSYRGSLFLPERSHARNAYEELALLN